VKVAYNIKIQKTGAVDIFCADNSARF